MTLVGPQVLLARRRVVRDHRVRRFEDPLRRPVVLVEHDDRRFGERVLELQEVAEVGAAELVDALRVVADDHDAAVFEREQAHDLPLRGVRVLELVDEHVPEPLLVPRAALRGTRGTGGPRARAGRRSRRPTPPPAGAGTRCTPRRCGARPDRPPCSAYCAGRISSFFSALICACSWRAGNRFGIEVEVAAHPVGEARARRPGRRS